MDAREFAQEIAKRRHIPDEVGDLIVGLMLLSVGVYALWFRNGVPTGIDALYDAFGKDRISGTRRIIMEASALIYGGVFTILGVVQLIAYFLGIPFIR